MSDTQNSPPTPWSKREFGPEDYVPDERPSCLACGGTGRVREWSTLFALIALAGFGAAGYVLYRMLVEGQHNRPSIRFFVILLCVGVFGLYVLLDRGECRKCEGIGRLEDDDDRSEPDDEP